MRLAVSEVFYSIQGEGQTMGVPAVFVRLGGCNLLCESKDWRCDTIEVWSKSKSKLFEQVLDAEMLKRLKRGAHLIITGGEPLIHQKRVVEFLNWFIERYGFKPIIEVETNGTIIPCQELCGMVSYWNVSPKLSSAGEQNDRKVRINDEALNEFSGMNEKTIFKFVISKREDAEEVAAEFFPYISIKQVVLMPAGATQDELGDTRETVAEIARDLGVRYSDRLHVVIWNKKTGV